MAIEGLAAVAATEVLLALLVGESRSYNGGMSVNCPGQVSRSSP